MSKEERVAQTRRTVGLLLFVAGLALGILALTAEFLGLDFTPGFGIVQMFQLLLAISFLTAAGFIFLRNRRPANAPRSLQAGIGGRLAITGLIFCFVAGLSDLIGIGTHVEANGFARPFVGPLQLGGIGVGIASILAGMYLYTTSRGARQSSSMDFLTNGQGETERPAA